jgi:pimeloyl-ACP methyl ester carboxylesterase
MKALFLLLLCSPMLASQLQLAPCTLKKTTGFCGKYSVPEDRAQPHGRHISLRVFVVPPPDAVKKQPEPLFLIDGGPGISVVDNLANLAGDVFLQIGRDREIVAVDERGTGESNPLRCPSRNSTQTLTASLSDISELARECLPWAKAHGGLENYHSLNAIRDLDDVRQALGYDKINLWGLSHGSREVLLYIKHYGQHVRAAAIEGPFPPQVHLPAGMAQREEQILETIFKECAADRECSAEYPDVKPDYARALSAFSHGDVRIRIADPATRQEITVSISKGRFGEILRNLLYTVPTANRIPGLLHSAAQGDWVSVVHVAASQRFDRNDFPFAQWASYVCAEDIPYVNAAREHEASKGTVLGDYRVMQQKKACSAWPAAHLPRGWDTPARSSVPVLFMVGELDVVVIPEEIRETAKLLPNSKIVEVAHGGHLLVGQPGEDECVLRIEGDFIDRGSAAGIDTTCAAALPRGPWK